MIKEDLLIKNGVIYRTMEAEDVEEVSAFFSRTFRTQEPLSKALCFDEMEFKPIVDSICQKALEAKMAIIGRAKDNNVLLGFSIGKDYGEEETFDTNLNISTKFDPLLSLHNQIDLKYRAKNKTERGTIFLHHTLGVDLSSQNSVPDVVKQEIIYNLFNLTYAKARDFGYQKIVGHATSLFTQKLYVVLGFKEVARINYNEFEFRNTKPFSGIKWHRSCVMFESSLILQPE